jgi:type II secretory ATPase GspE/PulE/Tfp pilus assembly ATPase PilB-like protein
MGVLAQRLVRRVCDHCKTEAEPTREERAAYQEELGEDLDRYYAGMGCNFCRHTGFRGRIGVFELLVMDDDTQQLFLHGASAAELKSVAEAQGMIPMRRDGMLKVQQGVTTPAEVIHRVFTLK